MAFYCYMLKCADGTYYTGWSIDPQYRLRQHNAGRGARYTRSRLPVRLVYVEELPDRVSAMRREVQIKRLGRAAKEKLIHQVGPGDGDQDEKEINRLKRLPVRLSGR